MSTEDFGYTSEESADDGQTEYYTHQFIRVMMQSQLNRDEAGCVFYSPFSVGMSLVVMGEDGFDRFNSGELTRPKELPARGN